MGVEIEQKTNGKLFNYFRYGETEGSPTSIRKCANELKVHKKTVCTGIKQNLSAVFNPLDGIF